MNTDDAGGEIVGGIRVAACSKNGLARFEARFGKPRLQFPEHGVAHLAQERILFEALDLDELDARRDGNIRFACRLLRPGSPLRHRPTWPLAISPPRARCRALRSPMRALPPGAAGARRRRRDTAFSVP